MSVTFERLRSPKHFIGKCQGMLSNHMQCTKGASYLQTDDSTAPPTEQQFCTAHIKANINALTGKPQEQLDTEFQDPIEKITIQTETKKEEQKEETLKKDVKPNVNTAAASTTST